MSITQTITVLPTPPNPDDPTTFDDRAYAFTDAQVDMVTELNTMISQINSTEADINTDVSTAQSYASDAQSYASDAQLYSENAASSANFKGNWSSATTYALGDSCYYSQSIWRSVQNGNLNNVPSVGSAYWIETWRQNMEYGHCILKKSGSDLALIPYNGNQIFINGAFRTITAPVTLSATGLLADTLYYIYAYMSGSVIYLEASTTSHTQDSTYGHEIKSGDTSKTLVGMAKTITGPAWEDSNSRRFVRSWYNREFVSIYGNLVSDYTFSTPSTWTELDASTIKSILCWDKEIATIQCLCSYFSSVTAIIETRIGVGVDSVRLNAFAVNSLSSGVSDDKKPVDMSIHYTLAEGAHTFHLYGYVGSTYVNCGAGSYISVKV